MKNENNPKYYELLRCLHRLVELKEQKDKDGKSLYYLVEQPKAWQWAKNLLKSEKKFFIEENNSVKNKSYE